MERTVSEKLPIPLYKTLQCVDCNFRIPAITYRLLTSGQRFGGGLFVLLIFPLPVYLDLLLTVYLQASIIRCSTYTSQFSSKIKQLGQLLGNGSMTAPFSEVREPYIVTSLACQ